MTDPDTTTDTTTEEQRHVERLRLLFKALEHEYDAIAHDPEERVPRIRLSAPDEDGLADAASRAVEVFGGFVAGPFDAPETCFVEAHIADPPADVEGPTGVEYRLEREWFPADKGGIGDVDTAALEETIHDTEVLLS